MSDLICGANMFIGYIAGMIMGFISGLAYTLWRIARIRRRELLEQIKQNLTQ